MERSGAAGEATQSTQEHGVEPFTWTFTPEMEALFAKYDAEMAAADADFQRALRGDIEDDA